MEYVIVFNTEENARKEIAELLQSKGYDLIITDNRSDFLSIVGSDKFSKALIYVQNLSDMRFLNIIHSLREDIELILIVRPSLFDIISFFKENRFQMIKDITDFVPERFSGQDDPANRVLH